MSLPARRCAENTARWKCSGNCRDLKFPPARGSVLSSPAEFPTTIPQTSISSAWQAPLAGALEVLRQLQGFEIPASAWERFILARRISDYDPANLDQLCLAGAVGWEIGRAAWRQR